MNPQPKPALRYAEGQWSAAVPVRTDVTETWPKAADVETAPDAALIPLPPQLDPALAATKSGKSKKKRDSKSKDSRKAKSKKKDGRKGGKDAKRHKGKKAKKAKK